MAWSENNDVIASAKGGAMIFNNGTAVTHVNIHGTMQYIGPSGANGLAGINVVQSSGEINGNLYNRFDDPSYYYGA